MCYNRSHFRELITAWFTFLRTVFLLFLTIKYQIYMVYWLPKKFIWRLHVNSTILVWVKWAQKCLICNSWKHLFYSNTFLNICQGTAKPNDFENPKRLHIQKTRIMKFNLKRDAFLVRRANSSHLFFIFIYFLSTHQRLFPNDLKAFI